MPRLTPASLWRRWGYSPGIVLETYPGLRIGNYLYFALQTQVQKAQHRSLRVLDSGLDPSWVTVFPSLREAMATRQQILWSRRTSIPPDFFQRYGVDFTAHDLELFVRSALLGQALRYPLDGPVADLVVNVRRGDYVSPPFKQLYEFDIPHYVHLAVSDASETLKLDSIQVVSDDLAWCRSELGWLQGEAKVVTFGASAVGPVGDFMTLARARALVLANSTFSYWAAYVSQSLHGERHAGVWAPAFHQANVQAGQPWQHDPRWKSVSVSRPAVPPW